MKTTVTLIGVLAAGLPTGCIRRSFHAEAKTETVYSFGQPRLAFSYVGLGWCYYVEDTNMKPNIVKTGLVQTDIDVNLDTGMERKDKFEIVFVERKYLKAHNLSFEFDAFSKWSTRQFSNTELSMEEFDALNAVSKELSMIRVDIDRRVLDNSICEKINSGDGLKLTSLPTPENKAYLTEYKLRCKPGQTEILRKSEVEKLNGQSYKFIRNGLTQLTTDKAWQSFARINAKCHDQIQQIEIDRGQYLGSETRKIF